MDQPPCKPAGLQAADIIFSIIVIFPLVVAYWSSTWKFMDLHMIPDDGISSSVVCITIGVVIIVACYISLPLIRSVVLTDAMELNFTSHFIWSLIYNYMGALGSLFLWRGVWNLSDQLTGKSLTPSVTLLLLSLTLLLIFRSTGATVGSPYVVIVDCNPSLYFRKARFRTQFRRYVLHVLDIFFTVTVIQPCAILVWAGAWNTSEAIIMDKNANETSYFIGMAIGLGLYILVFLLQRPTCSLASKLYLHSKWLEMAFGNLFRVFVFFSCITLWRATWGYLRVFVLSSEFVETRLWLLPFTHCLSIFLLLVLQVSSTLSPVGCPVDSELAYNGAGVKLCLDYFNHFCGAHWPESLQVNYMAEQEDNDDDPLLDAT